MFEKEIKFIGDFSFNQVRAIGSSFTLDKIVSAGVHPAIIQYISAELDYMIYSDRRKLLQQSYFDYAGKEILEHFQKISGEIKKHKKISLDDSKKLIFQAVSFNINYLVRPRWSLMKLIFNEQPVISVEEMNMMLKYLYYYEYFKKVLNGYLSKRNLIQISSTEFDILLSKIDSELIESNQHKLISNSFTSMGDFFNIGGVDKNRLPLSSVEIFCKEKNLIDLILKFRKAIPSDVKRRYDIVEIERILFSPDVILKSEQESDLETESTTEKMIEVLDAQEIKNEIDNKIENDPEKSDVDTFLSPEEEDALLSLYNEDSTNIVELNDDSVITSDVDDISGSDITQVKTSLMLDEPVEKNIPDQLDSSVEFQKKYSDSVETAPSENLSKSENEIEEIVDSLSENFQTDENDLEDQLIEEDFNTLNSEEEKPVEPDNLDIPRPGVEKEIVQEIIEDFYGETPQEKSEEVYEVESEELSIADNSESNEIMNEKIRSLEDDLLNIFEGLDSEEFKFSDKERFSAEESEFSKEVGKSEIQNSFTNQTTDGFDEYLKSIDELIFTEKSTKIVQELPKVKTEEKFETSIKKIEKIEEVEKIEELLTKPAPVPVNQKNEKVSNKTRVLRQKDIFSYLKRKEIKKIISFIFVNDEEDFTNTSERIMDCHSYKEASDILKAIFTSYKISPYSKEAITFTNAVSNYFRQA